jgi:hypothetical protein
MQSKEVRASNLRGGKAQESGSGGICVPYMPTSENSGKWIVTEYLPDTQTHTHTELMAVLSTAPTFENREYRPGPKVLQMELFVRNGTPLKFRFNLETTVLRLMSACDSGRE